MAKALSWHKRELGSKTWLDGTSENEVEGQQLALVPKEIVWTV